MRNTVLQGGQLFELEGGVYVIDRVYKRAGLILVNYKDKDWEIDTGSDHSIGTLAWLDVDDTGQQAAWFHADYLPGSARSQADGKFSIADTDLGSPT